MTWTEFRSLLQGIGPDTPLVRTVQIRLENDKNVLEGFTSSQHAIRNKWRSRQLEHAENIDIDSFLEQMESAFLSMA